MANSFEQQVAEVLDAVLKDGFERDISFNAISRGTYLAPRVAAAIQAGGVRVAEILARDLPPDDVSWHGEPEAAALAALRGETP